MFTTASERWPQNCPEIGQPEQRKAGIPAGRETIFAAFPKPDTLAAVGNPEVSAGELFAERLTVIGTFVPNPPAEVFGISGVSCGRWCQQTALTLPRKQGTCFYGALRRCREVAKGREHGAWSRELRTPHVPVFLLLFSRSPACVQRSTKGVSAVRREHSVLSR